MVTFTVEMSSSVFTDNVYLLGWWLVFYDRKQGWVPASYLQPLDSDTGEEIAKKGDTMLATIQERVVPIPDTSERGEEHVAVATYCGDCPEDASFPEGAKVEVLEKNSMGWWVVR